MVGVFNPPFSPRNTVFELPISRKLKDGLEPLDQSGKKNNNKFLIWSQILPITGQQFLTKNHRKFVPSYKLLYLVNNDEAQVNFFFKQSFTIF